MTNEQINVACAEQMGWKPCNCGAPSCAYWLDLKSREHLPSFTIDANAALTLVDALKDAHEPIIRTLSNGEWTVEFCGEHWQCFDHIAPTFPLAICGAFLKAKGINIESEEKTI